MSTVDEMVSILSAQSKLNESVATALQALALMSDRYDDALERIYLRLDDIEARLIELDGAHSAHLDITQWLVKQQPDNGLHSVKEPS